MWEWRLKVGNLQEAELQEAETARQSAWCVRECLDACSLHAGRNECDIVELHFERSGVQVWRLVRAECHEHLETERFATMF